MAIVSIELAQYKLHLKYVLCEDNAPFSAGLYFMSLYYLTFVLSFCVPAIQCSLDNNRVVDSVRIAITSCIIGMASGTNYYTLAKLRKVLN